MSDTLVITPTYNEKENIEAIIRKVFSLNKDFDMLIIEDNSPDGTADIVKRLMQEFPDRLFIKERKGKLGLGTAYLDGFRWGLEHGYDYMIEMDADFSHNPEDLPRLYEACSLGKGDVVVGSRYVDGKISVVNWPMGRLMMSYFASVYVRIVTRMKVMDATAGFVCYSRKQSDNNRQYCNDIGVYIHAVELQGPPETNRTVEFLVQPLLGVHRLVCRFQSLSALRPVHR